MNEDITLLSDYKKVHTCTKEMYSYMYLLLHLVFIFIYILFIKLMQEKKIRNTIKLITFIVLN